MFETPDVTFFKEKGVYHEPSIDGSAIVEFYKRKCVLVTGATGLLGKLLIEKLLRCCQDIDCVFLLIRDKKGQDFHTRVDEIFNDVIFERLGRAHPKFRHKIAGIKGDVSAPALGLSPEDRKLLTERVNVIYHVAATVRFDEKLKNSMQTNVFGTEEMLNLAKECKQMDVFVHVSTAYANCQEETIEERFYELGDRYEQVVNLVREKSADEIAEIEAQLMAPWPNAYTFTKALAEHLCKKYEHAFPLCVFRPAVVVPTYKEPIRAWTNNFYGPSGVIAGAGFGLLKSLYAEGSNYAEIVPADMVINCMIVASYDTHKQTEADTQILNYVSSVENPITWNQFLQMNRKYGLMVPSIRAFWYYNFRLTASKFIHLLYTIFFHFLPAIVADVIFTIMGKERQLLRAYLKIHRFAKVIAYFSIRKWMFTNDNVQELWRRLPANDRRIFPFDMKQVDWDYHSHMHIMGLRTYLIKEDPSTLPEARKRWQRLRILDYILRFAFYFIALRLLYSILTYVCDMFY